MHTYVGVGGTKFGTLLLFSDSCAWLGLWSTASVGFSLGLDGTLWPCSGPFGLKENLPKDLFAISQRLAGEYNSTQG